MIVRVDSAADVGEQMRRDHEVLVSRVGGAPRETEFRVFRIEPHGISLGASQRAADELDLERCRAEGVRWANRPTGGRAIYHAREWTFSMVTCLGHDWAADLRSAYARTGQLLVAALRSLGVPADLAPPRAGRATPPRGSGQPAPPCFASAARFEVVVAGRKAAGIAQRLDRGVLLQQGSILLSDGHERLLRLQRRPAADLLAAEQRLRGAVAAIGPHLEGEWSLERLAGALVASAAALDEYRAHKTL